MVGVEPIVDVAHAMETVLREANRAAGQLPPGALELLLSGVKAIEQRVQALAKQRRVAAAPAGLIGELNALRQASGDGGAATAETSMAPDLWAKLSATERAQLVQGLVGGRRALVVQFVPTPARASEGITITTVREQVAALAEIVKVVPQSMAASDASPGGLAFALILLTEADDAAVADAGASDARGPHRPSPWWSPPPDDGARSTRRPPTRIRSAAASCASRSRGSTRRSSGCRRSS